MVSYDLVIDTGTFEEQGLTTWHILELKVTQFSGTYISCSVERKDQDLLRWWRETHNRARNTRLCSRLSGYVIEFWDLHLSTMSKRKLEAFKNGSQDRKMWSRSAVILGSEEPCLDPNAEILEPFHTAHHAANRA